MLKQIKSYNDKIDFKYKIILWNILMIVLVLAFATPRFETVEDYLFSALYGGAFGESTAFTIYNNIFLGFPMSWLYAIDIGLNWWVVFEYACVFVSMTVFGYLLLRKNTFLNRIIVMLSLGACSMNLYIAVQFTKVSTICAVLGGLSVIIAIWQNDKKFQIIGAVIAIIGLCMRSNSFYMAIPYLGCGALMFIVHEKLEDKEKNIFAIFKKYFVPFVIIMVVAISLEVVNLIAYNIHQPGLMEYNTAHQKAADYVLPAYDGIYAEKYEEIGVSANDLFILTRRNNSDLDFFNTEKLNEIASVKPNRDIFGVFRDFSLLYKDVLWKQPVFKLLVLLFVGGLFCLKLDKIIISVLTFGGFQMYYLLLLYIQRYPARVVVSITLGAVAVLLCGIALSENKRFNIFAKIIMVVLASIIMYKEKNMHTVLDYSVGEAHREFYKELSADDEHIYIADLTTLPSFFSPQYNPFVPEIKGLYDNIIMNGCWQMVVDVVYDNTQEKLGTNPMKALLNDNVILMDRYEYNSKLAYVREHYKENAEKELVKTIGEIEFYKIS